MPDTVNRSNGGNGRLTLRDRPERWILRELEAHEFLTYEELTDKTGLSRAAVSTGVTNLERHHLLVRREVPSDGGRPRFLVSLQREAGLAIGVDFGWRHVRIALADLLGGSKLASEPPPEAAVLGEYESWEIKFHLDEVEDNLATATRLFLRSLKNTPGVDEHNVAGVCVGAPAPIDQSGKILGGLGGWEGRRPAEELRKRLDWNQEFLHGNDATLGAMAELDWGAARGASTAIYIKFSMGIGAGVIMDGEVQAGGSGLAGEIGHVVPPGVREHSESPCQLCGRGNCLDALASGTAIVQAVRRPSDRSDLHVRDVVERARREYADGEQGVNRQAIGHAAELLGRVLGPMVTILNPEVIVIGGAFKSGDYALIADDVYRGLKSTAMRPALRAVDIRMGKKYGSAGALGAVAKVLRTKRPGFLEARLEEPVRAK